MKRHAATALAIAIGTVTIIANGLAVETAAAQNSPHDVAMRVADRLIMETTFGFVEGLPRGRQQGFYLVDFLDAVGAQDGAYLARTELKVDTNLSENDLSHLVLGISFSSGDIRIEVDGEMIYAGSGDHTGLRHLDYNLVQPALTAPVTVQPGSYPVTIRFDPIGRDARIWIGLMRSDNDLEFDGAEFVLPNGFRASGASSFLVRGVEDDWFVPRVHVVSKLPHRLAYSDWRYFTGTFLDAMYTVSDTFDDLEYGSFVRAHMDFFLQQRPIIERERRIRGLIESPFGHYFRFSLLDDMGMQTVPFAERLRRDPTGSRARADRKIVDRSLDHILNQSSRLPDGTWARLNPDSLTVWADDLFMGSILLSRLGYFDEAAEQVIAMDRYLRDAESDLYWHGYFAASDEHSSSKWGRANGWTMMAKTDLLMRMPADHAKRAEVLEIFQRHAEGLLAVQSDDGRWHQVLDNADTYLETSCTAMFTRAFAEGVARGWLPEEGFREAAERGWAAVAAQVHDDGKVAGIVRGTPIFYSDQEYQDHGTRLNDPRGLGAVLYAAASMQRLSVTSDQ